MSYIGRGLQSGAFRQLDDISSGFDGSDTTHTMQVNSTNVSVGDVNQIILSLGGVIQKPGTDFTVSGSTLTFTTAPAAGLSFFAILLGSDNGGTVTPTDGSVTGDKVASTGAFTIGAAGTASSIAGLPIYVDSTNNSVYTFDVSGTDDSAQNNTAFGLNAADAITTADSVTVFGRNAGSAITTASSSTFFGKEAGVAVTEGTNNVLMGVNAGHSLTTGGSNIAIGATALDGCDTESHNIAIGRDALGGSIAGGEYNIAIGNYAGDALTSGDHNVFIGYNAGTDHTTASECVFVGHEAGYNATTAGGTTALGYRAIYENTATGNENTALGAFAGYRISSGASNTIIGYDCATLITSGSNNIMIGVDAGVTGSPGGAIGTGSNNVGFGDENISSCHIQTDWTVASDQRDKTDFTALDLGLDFVNDLKPYTFKWDKRIKYVSKEDRNTVDLDTVTSDGTHKEDWLDLGFKAQDVEALEKTAGYKIADKTNLTTSLTEDGKQYGIKYSNFVPILVKAIQELSAKVKALEDA
jgi:hypothetical protein